MLLGAGCAHQIDISPPLNSLDGKGAAKVNKTVGYYISPEDRAKEVTTPGGGGDKVKYFPYRKSEPALNKILSNIYAKVVAVPSLADKQFIASNNIAYVFVPTIETNSSSSSFTTWPPTDFSVSLECKATNNGGSTVWQKTVKGEGKAEFAEFKHDFSLAGRRASKDAFAKLQQEIQATRELK